MGRWLVILTLAMAQCPDIVAASPQSDIQLSRPRPTRRDHQVPTTQAPAVKAVAPGSSSPWPVAEPDAGKTPDEKSPLGGHRVVRGADDATETPAEQYPAHESPALPPAEAAPVPPPDAPVKPNRANVDCSDGKRVVSTYYWQGQRTASGERFDPHGMTAAHRTLPFGTRLNVSNPRTGKTVTVVVNDRGPFRSGVGIDLSLGAAQAIGMRGIGAVCIW
jgi:peptidoglycan lytic transglycosylase